MEGMTMINKKFINKNFNIDMDGKIIINKLKGLKNKFDNKAVIKAERKTINHKVYYSFLIFRKRKNYFYYQKRDIIINVVCNNQDINIKAYESRYDGYKLNYRPDYYYRADIYYDLSFLKETNFSFYDKKSERIFHIFIRNNKDEVNDLMKFYKELQKIDRIKKDNKNKKEKEKFDKIKKQDLPLFNKVPVSAIKEVLKKLPVYFFEEDKKGFCTSCQKETSLIKLDKHLSTRKCPNCKKEVKVQRVSKCKGSFYDFEWLIVPNEVNGKVTLSYIYGYQHIFKDDYKNIEKSSYERGREVISDNGYHRYIKDKGKWEFLNRKYGTFFSETCGLFNNFYNKEYCGNAYLYSKGKTFVENYKSFNYLNKYYSKDTSLIESYDLDNKDDYRYLLISLCTLKMGEIFEKLEKVGLSELITEYLSSYSYYYTTIFDYKKSSIIDILKLNRTKYKYLLKVEPKNQLLELHELQKSREDFIEDKWVKIKNTFGCTMYDTLCKQPKLFKYLINQTATNEISDRKNIYQDYLHYVENLKKLGYKLTKLYLYPKDFYKADKRVSDEIIRYEQIKEDLQFPERKRQIKIISDALRKMPNLDKYLDGEDGLKVYVPESPEELRIAGKDLANCIGSYVQKVAEGNTFIFFIRKISDPDTNYYAMEYREGEIIQIRGYANKSADEKIKQFCKSFQQYLIKQKFNPKKFLQAAA